ncbi:ureidoglycolate lyase [Salinibacter sp. 10B]|uniref:fumarylacetoacetate hydrolase family protein n=1 Tax=Salinibacter sp. 10B TaxID=1923971 RepID=UPI000CF55C7B|nr:fumarylacetoacetate hydrolase family protein [Salinibacter sp. 10B]PQJ33301.1 ureidoglycolate lyase [Salinibacter sp. 10B]
MKLIRFGDPGHETPGVLREDGTRIDTSSEFGDYDTVFFEAGGLKKLREWTKRRGEEAPVVPDTVRLGPPIARPSKIVCIGLNYSDHAAESDMEVPDEPVIFFKAPSAVCGPNDNLVLPKNSTKTDWEVELAVVIGREASYVQQEEALEYVAGYTLHNDYSERSYQLERGGQWVKGKSCDTFAPLGPVLATPDEVDDVGALDMWLDVNGERKQSSSTRQLIFGIPILVSYLSQFMTLRPGDVISTGTPAGVGLGEDPPEFLAAGDVVSLGIEGLGKAEQQVTTHPGEGQP